MKRALDEGEKLRERIKVLEAVLPVREQLSLLLRQRHQNGPGQASERRPPLQIVEELQSSSSKEPSPSVSGSDDSASAPVRVQLNAAPAATAAANVLGGPQNTLRGPRDDPAFLLSKSADHGGALPAPGFAHGPGPEGLMPFSMVQPTGRLPHHIKQNLLSFWNDWVREAALVLHAHDSRPHDPVPLVELGELQNRLAATFVPLRTEYPLLLSHLLLINLKTGLRDEPPSESFWVPIAQALKLMPEQLAGCRAAVSMCRERLEKVRAERRVLLEQLAEAISTQVPTHGSRRDFGVAVAAMSNTPLVEEITAQLYRNVALEGHALETIKDFMGSRLFSLVQMARTCVLSYPYFPDGFTLLNTVIAISGGPAPEGPSA